MSKKLTFQEIILTLQQYWNDQGCMLMQAYDPNQDLTHRDKKKAEELREASILDNEILHEDSHAHVRQEMGISKKD